MTQKIAKPYGLTAMRFCLLLLGLSLPARAGDPPIRKDIPASQLPKNIVTSFHRRSVDSTEEPWKAVGRVNINGTVHCSGTLIAPDVVLTAAHCLYSQVSKDLVPPTVVHFLAGYSKGEYLAHARARSYIVGPEFDGGEGPNMHNLPFDWALLLLEAKLDDGIGFMELHSNLKPIPPEERIPGKRPAVSLPTPDVTTAGYPGDRAHVLSLEENCKIRTVLNQGKVLMTDCIAIKGDSGGPILQQENGKWVVIGTQTGATMINNIHVGIGVSALAFRDSLQALLDRPTDTETDTPIAPENEALSGLPAN